MQLDIFGYVKGLISAQPVVRLGDGRKVPYSLRRSARAKNVWLKVVAGRGLEVVAPERMPVRDLNIALEKKAGWIDRHLKKVSFMAEGGRPPVRDGSDLPLLGKTLTLSVTVNHGLPPSVRHSGSDISASVPDSKHETLKAALETWYRKTARKSITKRLETLSGGRFTGKVAIKDQKTRWGSCSARGNLNFNWRLVMAPQEVMDYLIIHELVHLEQPDHSVKFWRKVEKRCPDFREKEAWLKAYGKSLTLG